ncbi:ATP-binding protein [Trichothermofontia sp.]
MPSLPIARITHPVAICSADTELTDLVTRLLQADSSIGVMLDTQQHPIGVVRLHRLLAYQPLASSLLTTGAVTTTDLPPVSLAATPCVEPIGLLPVSLSLPELCAHLARQEGGHWAIVTEQGQFLGLLNGALALSWLASQWDRQSSAPWGQPLGPVVTSSHSPKLTASRRQSRPQIGEMTVTEPGGGARSPRGKLLLSWGTRTLAPPTLTPLSTLPLGWQWLDSLPFPLQLQTDTGMIWGQNQAWSQTFGDRPPDVPTAPPTGIDTTPTPLRHAYAYLCTLDTGEEQVWQFLSLPLPIQGGDRGQVWEADQYLGGNPAPADAGPMRLLAAIEVTPLYTQNQSLMAENGELWLQAQAKDEFLLSLSHDIKTPLSAILGLASLVQTAAVGPLNPRQQQYLQLIHHNARLLTTLANQSFELACLDLGQLKLSWKPVDLVAVCERAIAQSLQGDLPAVASSSLTTASPAPVSCRVIQQDWEIDGRAEYLVADELRLCQMLTHLLRNALQFSTATDQVGLRVSRWHPHWLALTVWDTGMGIPEAEQSRIFQKLQQLQFAHSPYPGGVGLGLALTYRLVRLHGGVISFLSQPGVGSEFTLLLPSSKPHGPLTQFPRSDAEGSGERLSASTSRSAIVLVTEPPSHRQTLITPLQALGYRVVVARFPQDLLEKAKCLQPSVIFLDESWLADTDTAILTVLQADPATAHLPIIATVPDSAPTSLLQSQVDGILTLPTQMSLLQSWLERLAVTRGEVKARVPSTQPLTLLSLSQWLPDPPVVMPLGSSLPEPVPIDLASVFYQSHHRLLEADDLEQAALLATVWQPDLLLVQGDTLADPIAYLAQISTYPELAQRMIVVLNFNPPVPFLQALDLRVFPYQLHSTMDLSHFLTYLQQLVASSPTS